MLFNSYEFIFLFLPITAAVFYALGRYRRVLAIRWLIVASLFFYSWWRPVNVLLIAPSILINFGLARLLQRLSADADALKARAVLVAGIIFNVAFLGYFKYANFFVMATDDIFGTHFVLQKIILPLGISFITFQKIAFLVDVASKRVERFTLQNYCLFVLFFPQLIAGPIVHYREVMPQLERMSCRYDGSNLTVGLTLFFAGLFKKAVLADGIAPFVTSIYERASSGYPITAAYAWMAAIGFTLQIYFDFSGYSDMAIGIARLFGVRLPPNFNSPLRATSIIDFWLRWHMTLTRFLTAYLYNPLTLWITRRRMAKGLKGLSGRKTSLGSFVTVLLLPTLLTMCISGLWHGAGYTFIFWGLLNGVYLSVNHFWHLLVRSRLRPDHPLARLIGLSGGLLTFVCVVAGMVFFRSPTMASAWNIIQGMIGSHGIALPPTAIARLGALAGSLENLGLNVRPADPNFFPMLEWILGLLALAWFAPNTQRVLAAYEPVWEFNAEVARKDSPRWSFDWNPSFGWALATAAMAAAGIIHVAGVSEFLYWQF